MAIPDYQSIMLPLLRFASDMNEHSTRESIEVMANEFELSDEERKELLPSGQQSVFDNRVGWARTYLKKAGLLESTKRGYFKITEEGLRVLGTEPEKIDVDLLKQYSSFLDFQNIKRDKNTGISDQNISTNTPEEQIEVVYQKMEDSLAQEILQQVKKISPSFFERLVIDLLLKMGYGGSRKNAGKAIGKSGDEGIDGVINEDRLGLDVIYIQAKRWENPVGRPEIQKFVGALQGQRARKGIFITTSAFTNDAVAYASSIDTKVVLIDGNYLANLMITFNIGVSSVKSYDIKRVDLDYFTEE
ncbi:MAG: restriction endonuclease [candidate division Zixibacteria bacterium]|nr:restriction endonuclease [candidate division Zixibacteria bacterium]